MAKKKKKRQSRTKSKRSMRLKLKQKTVYSIVQIFFISLAALVIVSFLRQGLILIYLNDFLIAYFSWTTIFLPFIFLSSGLLVSKFKTPLAQPNVVVGGVLAFISLVAISSAGKLGTIAWEGLSALLTPAGAFIVLLGTSLMGVIVLFNTSLDQVIKVLVGLYKQYIVRGSLPSPKNATKVFKSEKKDIKVLGGDDNDKRPEPKVNEPPKIVSETKDSDSIPSVSGDLEEKLVSNVPGEEKVWKLPPLSLLNDSAGGKADRGDIKGNAAVIEQTLDSFGITARVVEVNLGPAVTQYAIEVALGTKLSKITALERDLALALAAPTGTIRIEAPIPGRSLVGIELPNKSPEFVNFKKMMESDSIKSAESKLTMALGLDVSGKPVASNLGKMPHLLIAGQTGSGKSVCINTILSTILFRSSPSEVKFILVDPKRVELTNYNDIPHLLTPVIVEPKKVVSALRWLMSEMDRRYKLFAQAGSRNIDSYNEMSGFQALPYIVLVVDELADVMLFSPAEVEDSITRLAQMSRATGIHMILATQRPSVDVITGLIKANIPARIAFAVSSQVDSRVILDGQGAEKLLGKGDMLYLPPESAKPTRIQGAFISDRETNALTSFLRNQGVKPQYTEEVVDMPKPGSTVVNGVEEEVDELFKEAVEIVVQYGRASASLLQRRLSVGYARAARIVDQLEAAGVITSKDGSKPRDVLIKNVDEIFSK